MPGNKGSTKNSRRKLTPFLCQEMLYDYALGRLDVDRTAAVEEFLQTDLECRTILDCIHKGIAYSNLLGQTQLPPETLTSLKDAENALTIGRRYASWQEWPAELKWSIAFIFISAVAAGIVAVIPWSRLPSLHRAKTNAVELAQLPHTNEAQLEAAQEHQEGDVEASDQGSGDEEGDVPVKPNAKPDVKAETKPEPVASAKPVVLATSTAPPAAPPPSVPPAKAAVAAAASPPPATAPATSPAVPPVSVPDEPTKTAHSESDMDHKGTKAKGFVYRAFMTLSNLDELGPQITESIVELGGAKAGEVELGWQRGTGRYFHFVLPEANQEKLMEKLRAYGPVRMSKDPHPRVMPDGQVRFILWVESTTDAK